MNFSDKVNKVPWNVKMMIARLIMGLTQIEAADRIGTTQKMIWTWETGRSNPRPMSQKAIAMAYEVNGEELFRGLHKKG